MKDIQFRVLLNLLMQASPRALNVEDYTVFVDLLRNEAKKRGYDDEVQAYHHFMQGGVKKVLKKKPRKVRGVDKK